MLACLWDKSITNEALAFGDISETMHVNLVIMCGYFSEHQTLLAHT